MGSAGGHCQRIAVTPIEYNAGRLRKAGGRGGGYRIWATANSDNKKAPDNAGAFELLI
jgi:hypothetical protein